MILHLLLFPLFLLEIVSGPHFLPKSASRNVRIPVIFLVHLSYALLVADSFLLCEILPSKMTHALGHARGWRTKFNLVLFTRTKKRQLFFFSVSSKNGFWVRNYRTRPRTSESYFSLFNPENQTLVVSISSGLYDIHIASFIINPAKTAHPKFRKRNLKFLFLFFQLIVNDIRWVK